MRPVNILLVEDNEVDARSMKRYIKRAGAKLVKHCRNKKDFDAYWPESTADLIVLDLELGRNDTKRSGWEIATDIVESDRPIPIIIWSTFNDKDTWRRIPNHENMVGPLTKTASMDQFVGTLYTTLLRCRPDAETDFILPEGFTNDGHGVAPPNGLFSVKKYGTKEHFIIDSRFIRYAETTEAARIKIHYRDTSVECSNSLVGLIDYANNDDLVQISRYCVINVRYAFKMKSTDCVYVRSLNGLQPLTIGDEYRKNKDSWWGRLRSPGRGGS